MADDRVNDHSPEDVGLQLDQHDRAARLTAAYLQHLVETGEHTTPFNEPALESAAQSILQLRQQAELATGAVLAVQGVIGRVAPMLRTNGP